MNLMKTSNKMTKKRLAAAMALKHSRRYEEALAAFDGMEDLPAVAVFEVMLERSHLLLEMGRLADCIEAVDRVLAIDRTDPEAWYIRSLALEKQGNDTEAGKCWKRSVREAKKRTESNHPCEYWDIHGYDLDEMGCWGRYELCQDALIRLDPRNLEAWHEKANAVSNMGRYEESLPLFDRALQMDPSDDDYPFALLSKGHALAYLGRCDEAVALYDLALAIPGNNFDRIGETWHARGKAFFLAGRFEEALGSYEEAAQTGYWHLPGVGGKAHTLEKLGRYAEAFVCCDEILKHVPGDKTTLKLKALLQRKMHALQGQ